MALAGPAQRFTSFTKTENLGLLSVQSVKSSDVYNTITNKITEVSADLKAMVMGMTQESGLPVDKITEQMNISTRTVKDTFTALQDMTKFSQKDIEASIADMLPGDPVMQNAFKNLAVKCRDNAMSSIPGFKPFSDKLGCGNPGDGKCSSSSVSGLLNKLTGGAIGAISKSLQSMLRSLMALAKMGYSGGLCAIFGALANGMPASVVQRGAAGILGLVGGSGNVTAVMDVAMGITGMKDVNPSREVSGLVGQITDNFTIPTNIKPNQMAGLYDGITSAYDTINPGYDKAADGIPSLANMGATLSNPEYTKVAKSWLSDSNKNAAVNDPAAPAGFGSAVSYIAGKVKNVGSSVFGAGF